MNTSIAVLLERRRSSVQTVSPAATVAEAVQLMNQRRISSVLVAENGRLAGIFTERDVLRRVVGAGLDPRTTLLHAVMSRDVTTVAPGTTVGEALALFQDRRCRHLPVLEEGRIAGMISVGDVTRWLTELHRAEAEQLKDYIGGGFPA